MEVVQKHPHPSVRMPIPQAQVQLLQPRKLTAKKQYSWPRRQQVDRCDSLMTQQPKNTSATHVKQDYRRLENVKYTAIIISLQLSSKKHGT